MLLLLALLQLPPGYPGGRKADPPPPVAQPAPNPTPRGSNTGQGTPGGSTSGNTGGPVPRGATTGADNAAGDGRMRGGCKHLLDRTGVSVSVENTPDGAVLRFHSSDPRVAQQVAQQASGCLSKGRGRDVQNQQGDNQGDNNNDNHDGDNRDNGDERGNGRGHGKGHGKDKHNED